MRCSVGAWWLALLLAGLPVGAAAQRSEGAPGGAAAAGAETASTEEGRPGGVDDEAARHWFERGAEALEAGRFEEALEAFQRSYHLAPIERRPYILYNLGVAYDRLRMDAEALDAFETYLRLAPDGPRAEEARARVRVLHARLDAGEAAGRADPLAPAPGERAEDEEGEGVPWLWVAVGGGALVVGAVVAAVLLSSGGSGSEPVDADFGGPVIALH